MASVSSVSPSLPPKNPSGNMWSPSSISKAPCRVCEAEQRGAGPSSAPVGSLTTEKTKVCGITKTENYNCRGRSSSRLEWEISGKATKGGGNLDSGFGG